MNEMQLLWLIVAFTGFNVLGGISLGYWCWLCGHRAEHAFQDMRISMLSTAEWSAVMADKAIHTEANLRYFIEYMERRHGQGDELRRQRYLSAVRHQHAMSVGETAPALPLLILPRFARQDVRTEEQWHA